MSIVEESEARAVVCALYRMLPRLALAIGAAPNFWAIGGGKLEVGSRARRLLLCRCWPQGRFCAPFVHGRPRARIVVKRGARCRSRRLSGTQRTVFSSIALFFFICRLQEKSKACVVSVTPPVRSGGVPCAMRLAETRLEMLFV